MPKKTVAKKKAAPAKAPTKLKGIHKAVDLESGPIGGFKRPPGGGKPGSKKPDAPAKGTGTRKTIIKAVDIERGPIGGTKHKPGGGKQAPAAKGGRKRSSR